MDIELTKEEVAERERAIRRFRRHYRWLSENPMADQNEWPEMQANGGDIPEMYLDCNLCDYGRTLQAKRGDDHTCGYCPIDWAADREAKSEDEAIGRPTLCMSLNTPYSLWLKAKKDKAPVDRIAALAKQISELPEKEIVNGK